MEQVQVRQLSPKATKTSLMHAIKCKRPVHLWGPPGVGKSDIVHQIAHEMDAHVVDIRLSLWEPTDIKGIPYYNSDLGSMTWAPPAELPDAAMATLHRNIILFLDEMNSAPPAVQAAAYQLILNRRVGAYVLPDNVFIVAAGNRESDKGVTFRMPSPLANRFIHLEMRADFNDWFDWSIDNSIHQDVIGFLSLHKNELYDFDPRSSSRSFATPRSWSFVSELLDDELDHDTLTNLVSGAVGEGIALKFMAHRRHSSKMPRPEDVLSGKVTEIETKEISAMYSLSLSLCYELRDQHQNNDPNYSNSLTNFFTFSMNNFEPELVVMAVRAAMTQYQLPMGEVDDSIQEFHNRYAKYIHGAHR